MERIISPIELKASPDDGTITGYAAIFSHQDNDGDTFAPGSFKRSIHESTSGAKAWPVFLLQLSADDPIGSIKTMEEDENGLLIRAKIAPTTRGKEILSLLKMSPRPALSGLGVGFKARKFTTNKSGRLLTDIDLIAVSLVTFAAQSGAVVTSVKSRTEEPVPEPKPVPVVDWKAVAMADYLMLAKEMTRHNRNYR
jgi:HK97 family phage prohead protease